MSPFFPAFSFAMAILSFIVVCLLPFPSVLLSSSALLFFTILPFPVLLSPVFSLICPSPILLALPSIFNSASSSLSLASFSVSSFSYLNGFTTSRFAVSSWCPASSRLRPVYSICFPIPSSTLFILCIFPNISEPISTLWLIFPVKLVLKPAYDAL